MKTKDLIEMAGKNLWRRKLRTFLTILGVIIGTCSIIVMLSLGFGMSQSMKDQIDSLGSLTTITVSKGYDGGMSMGMGTMSDNSVSSNKNKSLDQAAVLEFDKIPHVQATMPVLEEYGAIVTGNYISTVPIKGIPPESMEKFEFNIEEGRLLQNGDDLDFVFGGGVKESFHNPKSNNSNTQPDIDLMSDRLIFTFDSSPMSTPEPGVDKPKYKDYKIRSVGVLAEGDMDNDWAVFMPMKSLEKLVKERDRMVKPDPNERKKSGYETVLVKVDDINNVNDVLEVIQSMGFEGYSLKEYLDQMAKSDTITQAILGGIGAVSLLVAAIGITNTMIMSIYERTKEIGVMKVIGASLKDIKRLFLLESAIIGFLGGFIGLLISILISSGINKFAPALMGFDAKISIIPIWLMLAAVGFSTFIGIASGYYPAKRAMNLSALSALQND